MPVYEYQCTACGHEFEREQRISEDPIKKCPQCGKQKAKRLISRTSFVLKGGGWYGDLYGSVKPGGEKKDDAAAGAGDSAAKEASAPASASSGEGAKPESKGEKKAEKKKKAAA